MTPQERQRVAELFDRLVKLEDAPRDPQAEQAIAEDWQRAPNAAYALVQTVLIQDEALRNADARIRALEEGSAPAEGPGSFLDSVRGGLFGRGAERRGSVPPVRSGAAEHGERGGGGSFLGTAAASAAGVIGGALLLNSFRSMFGGSGEKQSAMDSADASEAQNSPWGGGNADSNLAKDAGAGDIGRQPDDNRAGAYDTASNDEDDHSGEDDFGDDADFGGDSDFA